MSSYAGYYHARFGCEQRMATTVYRELSRDEAAVWTASPQRSTSDPACAAFRQSPNRLHRQPACVLASRRPRPHRGRKKDGGTTSSSVISQDQGSSCMNALWSERPLRWNDVPQPVTDRSGRPGRQFGLAGEAVRRRWYVPHCGMSYDGSAMSDIEHAQLVSTYINEWRCRHYPGV